MVYILGEVAPGGLEAAAITFIVILLIVIVLTIRSIIIRARRIGNAVQILKDKNISGMDKFSILMFGNRMTNMIDNIKNNEESDDENLTYDEAMEMLRKREEEMKNNNNHEN